jgi:hypothetical protein
VAVEKLSISLDAEVAAAARAAAQAAGMTLSAWLARAATEAVGVQAGLAAMREYESENGAFTDEERRWADEVLDSHGVHRRR